MNRGINSLNLKPSSLNLKPSCKHSLNIQVVLQECQQLGEAASEDERIVEWQWRGSGDFMVLQNHVKIRDVAIITSNWGCYDGCLQNHEQYASELFRLSLAYGHSYFFHQTSCLQGNLLLRLQGHSTMWEQGSLLPQASGTPKADHAPAWS